MLVVQIGGKMILPTQSVRNLTLSHHQLDIHKLLINLFILQIALCHAIDLIFCTNSNVISKHGADASIFEITILLL